MVMALGLAACGAKAEDANTVGTGKLETTEGETTAGRLQAGACGQYQPSTLNIGHAIGEEHTATHGMSTACAVRITSISPCRQQQHRPRLRPC